jgi:hypothetical protein
MPSVRRVTAEDLAVDSKWNCDDGAMVRRSAILLSRQLTLRLEYENEISVPLTGFREGDQDFPPDLEMEELQEIQRAVNRRRSSFVSPLPRRIPQKLSLPFAQVGYQAQRQKNYRVLSVLLPDGDLQFYPTTLNLWRKLQGRFLLCRLRLYCLTSLPLKCGEVLLESRLLFSQANPKVERGLQIRRRR